MLSLLLLACGAAPITPGHNAPTTTSASDALPADADLDSRLEVLFAPDDPVTTIELTLIDEVVASRQADPADYAEGSNPYRIRYAVYNLRNGDITRALASAEQAGVDVQILIEQDQLDPARDWNWADDWLVEQGFEYVEDHRDDFNAETADLIGIGGSGLMHLKTRLFETPDRTRLLTGSMNPGDNAVFNEETLHLVNDADVVLRYQAAYDAVLSDTAIPNAWGGQPVEVLFAPHGTGPDAGTRVLDWVESEDEQILLMIYSLRDLRAEGHSRGLVELLGDKVNEGVPVYVITDRKQSDGYWDTTEDELRAVGVHVYEATNATNEYTAMHHKVAVLGKTDIRVITDASNWTKSGLGSDTSAATNVESVLFIDSAALDDNRTGRRYLAQWLRVLERYADQSADDGEPSFEQVRDTLWAQADWPVEPLWFATDYAETVWGESIYVRGDLDALGAWGAIHAGVPLWTDAALYPAWSATSQVDVPVGQAFEWKYVASDGAGARWESGDNRVGFGQPPVLVPGGSVSGSWR